MDAKLVTPKAVNEPVREYLPGSKERESIKATYAAMASEKIEISNIIDGKNITTGSMGDCIIPHAHKQIVGQYHQGNGDLALKAVDAANGARADWSQLPWQDRAAIFLKAADLLAGPFRDKINAATMIGQSKTVHQAEIDAACELVDFFKFNVAYYQQIMESQPESAPGIWNQLDYRPLDGFVYAISPFNFTSIAANLAFAPALMGNTVIWKPSDAAVYSGWYLMELFKEAGVPDGVINFVTGDPAEVTQALTSHPDFAGLHFTGSTTVFQNIWQQVGNNISNYNNYPRLVGETGGKDFIVAHKSADAASLACAILRGSFEFQGQKCSAASRVYVPKSLWSEVKDRVVTGMQEMKQGDVSDYTNFLSAVIHQRSFDKISGYIQRAKDADSATQAEVVCGGECDDSVGFYIRPTLIEAKAPRYETMTEEIFGPVVTAYVYEDQDYEATLKEVDRATPYALTGAIFSQDRYAVKTAMHLLRNAAGNFYINDKPTGAVVGQQPFGGGRASGTNDKAGSYMNLLRWTSPRTIKETLVPATEFRYPFMGAE